MIHFQSNNLQYTIRCPQKVYIVSKWLLNMFFTLKMELNFQPRRISITNGIWLITLITILWSWTGHSHSGALQLQKLDSKSGTDLEDTLGSIQNGDFGTQTFFLACNRWCFDKNRAHLGIKGKQKASKWNQFSIYFNRSCAEITLNITLDGWSLRCCL